MLSLRSQCFGLRYNLEMLSSANRIVAKTMFANGKSYFIYWIIADREELAGRIPDVANGYDIFFIVDKDSIEIKDDDLIAAHYGCTRTDKRWIVFKDE